MQARPSALLYKYDVSLSILGNTTTDWAWLSQIALARSKLTGRVERRVTIYPGCHLLFPDTELIRFKGTAHNLLSDLEVSSSEGVVLRLKLSLQYFIK